MAAPTMAVIQVDRLKNPCRVCTWNRRVAAHPPPSAPMMPIRQVTMRPSALLPGTTRLASRPDPRPRTIQAMMHRTRVRHVESDRRDPWQVNGRGVAGGRVNGGATVAQLGGQMPAEATVGPGHERCLSGDLHEHCLLYTSDAADDLLCVDLGGR